MVAIKLILQLRRKKKKKNISVPSLECVTFLGGSCGSLFWAREKYKRHYIKSECKNTKRLYQSFFGIRDSPIELVSFFDSSDTHGDTAEPTALYKKIDPAHKLNVVFIIVNVVFFIGTFAEIFTHISSLLQPRVLITEKNPFANCALRQFLILVKFSTFSASHSINRSYHNAFTMLPMIHVHLL